MPERPPPKATDLFLAAALADYDQFEAHAKFLESTADGDDAWIAKEPETVDRAVELLRQQAKHFDVEIDNKVRDGFVVAVSWFYRLAREHACCLDHGAHLEAVARMFAATVAREQASGRAD